MNRIPKILLTSKLAAILLLGFAVPANMVGNWYQQFMPNLNNRPLIDITFIDSLNGFAITGDNTVGDTNYIIKTTNSGDNWSIIYSVYRDLSRVIFINQNTGFVSGGYNGVNGIVLKTTNTGVNWQLINVPDQLRCDDMSVLNEDTLWVVDGSGFDGVWRTTNKGTNWDLIFSGSFAIQPTKIYMYDRKMGFFSTSTKTYRTTDGGFNWTQIVGESGFRDMYFADSLTGWKANTDPPPSDTAISKTTNGGINWVRQHIPSGGNISMFGGVTRFSNVNRDTIWAAGGSVQVGFNDYRGILYKTTNGGQNWLYQIPDTGFRIQGYVYVRFVNKNAGWAYSISKGIHTTTGGDTGWIAGVIQISSEVPNVYKLFQNYPNPFNPATIISYQLRVSSYVKVAVYDLTGKHIIDLVNQKQTSGTYQVDFDGIGYSSGIYFYSLFIDNKLIETRKMILLK